MLSGEKEVKVLYYSLESQRGYILRGLVFRPEQLQEETLRPDCLLNANVGILTSGPSQTLLL